MRELEIIKELINKRKLTREEVIKYLFTNNVGDLDLSDLDFGSFGGNVILSGMKVGNNLYQSSFIVKGDLFQENYKVNGNVYRDCYNVKGDLSQRYNIVEGNLYQSGQEVKGNLEQGNHIIKGNYTAKNIEVEGSADIGKLIKSKKIAGE